jgi:uncharacterized protein YyaL (SSP411 family)
MLIGRPIVSVVLLLSFVLSSSCNRAQEKDKKSNRLINESSPYLLQHAYNPVDWYPWGEEAFARAENEQKPVIISIGYASCHWCHVMERESFEDDSVAAFMNAHFVNIKVDREERPDVDQIYIEAAQMINGRAGWPLNCIALPDQKPFFAGTYYPKDQWLVLLKKVNDLWENDRQVMVTQAEQITNGIKGEMMFAQAEEGKVNPELINSISHNWLSAFDRKEGGYKGAPKFPMPANLQTLLMLHKLNKDEEALEVAGLTLTKMAEGGIYDQAGGGFARYSTDAYWKVPHFEKMLYDNGQLLSQYAAAYQVTKNPLYKKVVEETIEFLVREMRSDTGGFYSSLDADSEGEEGLFYVWKSSEIDDLLGRSAPVVTDYYQISEIGNWEDGKNILIVTDNKKDLLEKNQLNSDSLVLLIDDIKNTLLGERAKRARPALDDKVITSWNALTIIGLTEAYRAFQQERYLELASETAQFLLEHMVKEDHRMDRIHKNNHSSINAFLDDYAFTISAFISLYQATFDEHWLTQASALTDYVIAHFSDSSSAYFFYTSDIDPALVARKVDKIDNVIPSGNSEMAKNLFFLGNYFYNEQYLTRSDDMLEGMAGLIEQYTSNFINWFQLYLLRSGEFYEVAIVGENFELLKAEMEQYFLPNVLLMGGNEEGTLELMENKLVEQETRIYVCREKLCKRPVLEVNSALSQIR